MSRENTTRYVILGLISHEPLSGYDIKKRVDIIVSHFWNVGFGQIYPTLAELEREGLAHKAAAAEEAKGPQKYVYTATEAGTQALQSWLAQPARKEYTKYEILLKLYFSGGLPAENSVRSIREFQERQQCNLALIQRFKRELESVLSKSPDHLNYYLTVLFGERVYSAYLSWAEDAQRLLGDAEQEKGRDEQ
jgi:DNA-binding PadR family transcriptional regulator